MGTTIIDISDLGKLITFGKYKGETWGHVLATDPDYLMWVDDNVDFIEFSEELFAKIEDAAEEDSYDDDRYRGHPGHPDEYGDR